jgi:hypothetical protein
MRSTGGSAFYSREPPFEALTLFSWPGWPGASLAWPGFAGEPGSVHNRDHRPRMGARPSFSHGLECWGSLDLNIFLGSICTVRPD